MQGNEDVPERRTKATLAFQKLYNVVVRDFLPEVSRLILYLLLTLCYIFEVFGGRQLDVMVESWKYSFHRCQLLSDFVLQSRLALFRDFLIPNTSRKLKLYHLF